MSISQPRLGQWSRTMWLLLLVSCVSAAVDCLRSADHITINQKFIDGGPGTKVFLCPDSKHKISGTIVFTAADQELATSGYPTGSRRATISIENDRVATAIRGDCRRCARISIKNVIVDGGRDRLGRIQDHNNAPGLIVIGGNEGQTVRQCWIKEPRGFTAVHVREGDKLQCRLAVIEGNEIGPVGEEYNPVVDGPDPEASPLGRPLADGISIACQDSTVRDNNIYDCTDAGIVVYCSPGTRVTGNTVSTRRQSGMGGIFMVDAAPFEGDYSGVMVQDNTFDAAGRAMRVGIGLGLSILGDDIETILTGGKVIHNHLKGRFMGYGIAAAGLSHWEITENWSQATHSGKMSARCFDDPVNPDPVAFLYHAKTITDSKVQPGFVDSDFAYVVCIDGNEDSAQEEARIHTPVALEEEEEAEADGLTGNDVMDGILRHSEHSVLNAIARLGLHIDSVSAPAQKRKPAFRQSSFAPLEARLEAIESSQSELLSHTRSLHESLKRLQEQTTQATSWETDVLLNIERELYGADKDAEEAEGAAQLEEESGWPWVYLLLGVGVLGAILGYCQWRPNRMLEAHNKVV